jgi:glucose-6-phosphate 1-epimerase
LDHSSRGTGTGTERSKQASMSSSSSTTIHTITHTASGASCRVHEFGATVLSFQTAVGRECLFLSRDSKLDGSKPVRGGIPLVFPIFGPPPPPPTTDEAACSTMPQHGFLRRNVWKFDESSRYDTAQAAGMECSLTLKDADDGRGDGNPWNKSQPEYDCTVVLAIQVEASQLTTTLTVKNTGTKAFPFQALFHTYYQVDEHAALDSAKCYVKGLESYRVEDKISGASYVQGSDPVTIQGNVDHVYTPPPLPGPGAGAGDVDHQKHETLSVTVGVGPPCKTMHMTAHGTVGGKKVPTSCVVWNPHRIKAEAMGDFGADQYVDMICVEPGLLGENVLEVGLTGVFVQVMRMPQDPPAS